MLVGWSLGFIPPASELSPSIIQVNRAENPSSTDDCRRHRYMFPIMLSKEGTPVSVVRVTIREVDRVRLCQWAADC